MLYFRMGPTPWNSASHPSDVSTDGKNAQQIKLYDHASGGCRDGLEANGVNENQGAESTLSYTLALLTIYNLRGLTMDQENVENPRSKSAG